MPYKDPEARKAYLKIYNAKNPRPKKVKLPPTCGHSDRSRKGDGLCVKCYKKKNGFKFLLRHRYGMTEEQYWTKFNEQGGMCAVCKETSVRRLSVDHNHDTGAIRGLLCVRCNAGIGHFREREDLFSAAAQYVGRWSLYAGI